MLRPLTVARAPGLMNVAGGLWPVVSLRTCGRFHGAATDGWLQKRSSRFLALAGAGMLVTFFAIDLVYVLRRRIPATYLMDAAEGAAWCSAADTKACRGRANGARGRRTSAG